ncbi:LysR family transcriptional regulator [Gordonibacter sp. 28C]|uniref:LysR family transcriptional regulator n=1 Tax=Gordonibacter sp. 28C TaxID=2078569 RepID=UPI001314784C|nr:LysR family transcriptional regulator [Gordonibacter sp. 28C]
MDLQVLKEYVEFAKYLNFSAAARMLHMSQSSLSKHIADLEKNLGFVLVSRKGTPTLTPAGQIFLETVEDVLFQLEKTVEKCKEVQHGHVGRIVIQDPLIDATIGNQSINAFMYFSEHYPMISIDLHTIRGQTSLEALNDGTVDIAYYMAYGDEAEIIEERARLGVTAFPMRRRRFAVWMRRDHRLTNLEELHMADLHDVPFLIPADRLFDDWRVVLEQASLAHGFFPKVNLKVTPTINGYFALNTKDGVVILSEAFLRDPRFLMRDDMVTHELADPDCYYTLFIVYREDNENPALPPFVERLKMAAAEEVDQGL